MAKVEIVGTNDRAVRVTEENELLVTVDNSPPRVEQKVHPFRALLTSPAGATEMNVNGSTTPVEFSINADGSGREEDIYLTSLSIIVGYGGTAQPYQFADGAALTNGLDIGYVFNRGDELIATDIKTNLDFLRLALPSIAPTDWEIRGVGGNNDYGYVVTLDFRKIQPPLGTKLDAGTKQRLYVRVNDDLSSVVDDMNAIVQGFKRYV